MKLNIILLLGIFPNYADNPVAVKDLHYRLSKKHSSHFQVDVHTFYHIIYGEGVFILSERNFCCCYRPNICHKFIQVFHFICGNTPSCSKLNL